MKKTKQSPPHSTLGPPPNFTQSDPPLETSGYITEEVQSSTTLIEKDSNSSSAHQNYIEKSRREAEIARVKSSNAQKQKEFNDKTRPKKG